MTTLVRQRLATFARWSVFVLVAGVPALAQQTRFHVALGGDDRHEGTADRPLATLPAALELVKARAGRAPGDVSVIVHEGVHRIVGPLLIGPQHVPRNGRLCLTAAEGTTPLISGGRAVHGFKLDPDGRLRATVPWIGEGRPTPRELFVNGRRRPRARHPNQGWSRVEKPSEDRRTGFTFSADGLPRGAGAPGLELLFLHDWSSSRVGVASVDHDARTLNVTHPIGPKAPHYRIDNFEKHPRFRLENDRALLDEAGEWFLDPRTGVLTYWPLPGESASAIDAVIPEARALLIVEGASSQPVRRVTVRGLAFAHAAHALPKGGYAAGQATFHEDRITGEGDETRVRVPAAIVFRRAEGCLVEDCRLAHLGTSGIAFGLRTRGCVLRGTVIEDVAGNGVILGEDTERLVGDEPWWKSAPDQAARGHEVSNCVVQDCGRTFPGAVGVWIGIASHLRVRHNVLRRLPYTGISVGWLWSAVPSPCQQNTVEFNHIHHVMQVLSDGGGIYTIGRQPGTVMRGNHIHDVPLNMGRAGSNGMFLDQGTADLLITGNLIHGIARSPLRFHLATSARVTSNVMVPAAGIPLVAYNATPKSVISLDENSTLAVEGFEVTAAPAARIASQAGLEPAYRSLRR